MRLPPLSSLTFITNFSELGINTNILTRTIARLSSSGSRPCRFRSPDYVRKWWQNNAFEWPLLATAARVLLATLASEVDVKSLFSGCRDEFGIRRHSLKTETVRVLTLLRSAYSSDDEVDKQLIKDAMELDIFSISE